jgi:hypothetical protein
MPSPCDYSGASARPESFQLDDATLADFSTPTTVFANDVPGLGHYGNANHESGNRATVNTVKAIDDTADGAIERSAPSPTPTPRDTTQRENENENESAIPTDPSNEFDYATVKRTMNCRTLDETEKLHILKGMPEKELFKFYNKCIATLGLKPPYMASATTTVPAAIEDINEINYRPLLPDDEAPSPDPNAPPPLYPAYTGHFRTAQDAKRHRLRTRVAPKSKAADIERVRRWGRELFPINENMKKDMLTW